MFDIFSVVLPDPKTSLCIPEPAADAAMAAVNPDGIKIVLIISWNKFFTNGKTVFSNVTRREFFCNKKTTKMQEKYTQTLAK